MKTITLHSEALDDLAQSVCFYEQTDNREIALVFITQVQIAIAMIGEDPLRFPRVHGYQPVQKCRVRGFPHSLYYINTTSRIWVIAVAHGSRRPGFWTDRLHS